MAKTIDDVTPEEEAAYYRSYFASWDIVDRTISLLERRKLTPGVTVEELNEIEVDLLWCASEQAKLKLRRTAFLRGSASITPPDEAQVEAIKVLTTQVEKLALSSKAAGKAVDLATDALTKFAEIQSVQAG
jgi:hypothetical protein